MAGPEPFMQSLGRLNVLSSDRCELGRGAVVVPEIINLRDAIIA